VASHVKKSHATFKTRVGQIVASRVLTDAKDPKRRIVMSLGLPRRVSSDEWQCPVCIDCLEAKPILKNVSGVDSLQALLLAAEYLRMRLKQSHCDLMRSDGTPCPAGDIPRQVPIYYGEEFVDRVEQCMDREGPRFMERHFKMLLRLEAEEASTNSSERPSSKRRRRSD
jgi:hypothetical protein